MTFWLNGEFSTAHDAIDIADRGFLLGDGIFETILVVNGIPAFLDAHLNRLRTAIAVLRLNVEIDESICAVISELATRNKLSQEMAALRITVARGPGPRGLLIAKNEPARPTVLATVSKYQAPSNPAPMRLAVSNFVRSERSISSRHKTLNYLDNVLARDEAAAKGCDDAVMLNGAGRVACISIGNIFQLTGAGAAVTPATAEGALEGVIRGILLDSAAKTGLSIEEGVIDPSSFSRAGFFVTNSLIGVRPAYIASANAAPITAMDKALRGLQSWYEGVLDDDLKRRAGEL